MTPPLVAAAGQAARAAAAPAAWNLAGILVSFALTLVAALGALGFFAAGCYLWLRSYAGITATEAAFATAAILLVAAGISAALLRRRLFGPVSSPRATVAEEAQRTVAGLQAEATAAVTSRPMASLLGCLAAGLLVGALRGSRKR